MKATNHSGEQKRNRQSLYRLAASSRAETALFATLGLVGLVGIVVAVVSGSVPAGSKEEPLAALERLPMVRYFRSGQWVADARTFAAMAHYIFEAEQPMVTNVIELAPTQKNLAMPTNSAAREPKA